MPHQLILMLLNRPPDAAPSSAGSGDANAALPQLRSHLSAASIASSTESSGDSGDKAAKAAAAASAASAAAAAVDDSDEIPISRGIVSGPEAARDAIQCVVIFNQYRLQ